MTEPEASAEPVTERPTLDEKPDAATEDAADVDSEEEADGGMMMPAVFTPPSDASCQDTVATGAIGGAIASPYVWQSTGTTDADAPYVSALDGLPLTIDQGNATAAGDSFTITVGTSATLDLFQGVVTDPGSNLEIACVSTNPTTGTITVVFTGAIEGRSGVTGTITVPIRLSESGAGDYTVPVMGGGQNTNLTYTTPGGNAPWLGDGTPGSTMQIDEWGNGNPWNWRLVVANDGEAELPAQTFTITPSANHEFICPPSLVQYTRGPIDSYTPDPDATPTRVSCTPTELVVSLSAISPGQYATFQFETTALAGSQAPYTVTAVSSAGPAVSESNDGAPTIGSGVALQPRAFVATEAPGQTAGVCVAGEPQPGTASAPTLTAGDSTSIDPEITYVTSADGATTTATVTYTTPAGYYFDENHPDFNAGVWTVGEGEVATATVTITNVPCDTVTPEAPVEVTGTVCVADDDDDEQTQLNGSITFATTEGVSYTSDYDPTIDGEQNVTITATVANGYTFGDPPQGWNLVNAGTATTTVTVVNDVCPEPTTGTVSIVKVYCDDIDEVLFNTDDDLDDCVAGPATFTFYLIGDGTAEYEQIVLDGTGVGSIALAPGEYEVIEEGTQATTTVSVTAGMTTQLVVQNPDSDDDTPVTPVPTTTPVAPDPKATATATATAAPSHDATVRHDGKDDDKTVKVTALPTTGSGSDAGMTISVLAATSLLAMAGAMLINRKAVRA